MHLVYEEIWKIIHLSLAQLFCKNNIPCHQRLLSFNNICLLQIKVLFCNQITNSEKNPMVKKDLLEEFLLAWCWT